MAFTQRNSSLAASLRDLLILVIGIMLSFWLTEWRQNNTDEKEEQRIISLLYQDLKNDTTQIQANIKRLSHLRNNYDTLMKYREDLENVNVISVYVTAYQLINFVPFQPKQTSYLQFTYREESETVKNKKILSNVIGLFSTEYETLQTLNETHKAFLLDKLAAKYFSIFPAPFKSPNDLKERDLQNIKSILENNEILNMLQFDVILKMNLEMAYKAAFTKAQYILELIHEDYGDSDWLEKLASTSLK